MEILTGLGIIIVIGWFVLELLPFLFPLIGYAIVGVAVLALFSAIFN
jgi:hypothetical protein